LGKIGNNAAVSALISELQKDGIDKNLKLNIISALGTAKSQAAVNELKPMLNDEDSDIHFTAADSLFQITGDGHGYKWSG
jgi:HEAT repeat protein